METKNLIIRETVFSDCEIFAKWETLKAVTEFFTIDEGRNYEEVVREFVERSNEKDKLQYTICLKPEGRPIGRVYISRIDPHSDSMDITRIYIADEELRGKGYGEEALRRILEHAFIAMHMERVTLDHFLKNKPAAALYEKVGFKDEGILRNAAKKNGRYYDLQLKSMLRNDYLDSSYRR